MAQNTNSSSNSLRSHSNSSLNAFENSGEDYIKHSNMSNRETLSHPGFSKIMENIIVQNSSVEATKLEVDNSNFGHPNFQYVDEIGRGFYGTVYR
jgi:hypothetical protein